MEEVQQFQQLIAGMMAEDNNQRKQAETTYENVALADRTRLLWGSFKDGSAPVENRSLCLVLLRRILSSNWDELATAWTPEMHSSFRAELLAAGIHEPDKTLKKRLGDVIAEVARCTLSEEGEQQWAEVLTFVHDCALSDNEQLKDLSMIIFELVEDCSYFINHLFRAVPGIFGVRQNDYVQQIKDMLASCLRHQGDQAVRSTAVRAFTAFVCDNEEDPHILRYFNDLMPTMIKVVQHVISLNDDDDIPLQCLGDLASSVPKMLRPQLNDVCQMCIQTAANAELESSLRHSALEVLVSLCESSAAMMRKRCSQYLNNIVEQCLNLMVEIEDDEAWHNVDEVNQDEDEDDATIGETSLDRLSIALGGKTIWPLVQQKLVVLMQSQEWQHRHAGIMALSTIGEGSKKAMEPLIEQIIDNMMPFLSDAHPRVRYATCNALGQMSTDFAPVLQKKCHTKLVPGLLAALEDQSSPRVAAHAGAALVNFSEECPKHILVAYLDVIMDKLQAVLQLTFKENKYRLGSPQESIPVKDIKNPSQSSWETMCQRIQELKIQGSLSFLKLVSGGGKKLVLEQVITTIASVADTAEEQFVKYYDSLMPCLKYILINSRGQTELRLLRGKTIECMSLVGLAVGTDKFLPDANEIMNELLKSQQELGDFGSMEADDPQISYMISAWARICKLMGPKFAPYLPTVMPAVLKVAEFKPEVTIVDEEDTSEENQDWQFVSVGDKQAFGIRTTGIDDKATACEMLVCYARELGEAFVDYAKPTMALMLPLLKFYFNDAVRIAAGEAMSYLLTAAAPKGAEFVAKMWEEIFVGMCAAIESEMDSNVRAEHLHSLSKCIDALGANAVDQTRMAAIMQLIGKLLQTHFETADARQKKRSDDDHDEEQENEIQQEIEDDTQVIARCSDVWHSLFMTQREAVVPYFEQLLPQLCRLLEPSRVATERQWLLCIFDDVIEYGGASALKYQSQIVPAMIESLSHQAPEVRQAAAYGFGVMGMLGENAYAQVCAQAVPALVSTIEQPGANESTESRSAADNAVAAVAKILKYNASMTDVQQVLPRFINWLPVYEDKEESVHIYGYFCDLIESNNPLVLGEQNANLPRILSIIVDAFRLDAFTDPDEGIGPEAAATAERMKTLLISFRAAGDVFEQCVQSLSAEQQATLHTLLQ